MSSSLFAATGTLQSIGSYNRSFTLNLPFTFTFYGTSYTSVQVSTEGFLEFTYASNTVSLGDTVNTDAKLIANRIIAPLWDNLPATPATSVYVNSSVSGQVTIRWQSVNAATNTPVNFDVVLFSNGQIRFDYGAGNTGVSPTVGISFGNVNAYQLPAAYDNQSNLANAHSMLFSLRPATWIWELTNSRALARTRRRPRWPAHIPPWSTAAAPPTCR